MSHGAGGGFDGIINRVALAATRLGVERREEFHRIVLDALFEGTGLGAASIWRLEDDVYVREAGRGVTVPDLPEGLRIPVDEDRRAALEAVGHVFVDTHVIDVDRTDVDLPDRRALLVPFGGGTPTPGMLVLIDPTRRVWSDDELAGVESLALLVAQTLGRFRAEELVHRQVRREALLARVGATGLAITPDTAGSHLDELLGEVLEHLDAVEAAIWRRENGILRRRWVVRRDGGPWIAAPRIDVTAIDGLLEQGCVTTPATAIADPSTGADGSARPPGSTIVAVAHDGDGELLGAFSLTDPDPDRRWDEADTALVRAIADVLGLLRSRLDVTTSLERQHELHAVLGEATERFIDATAAEAPAVIDRALERMRRHLGLSSVALLELDLSTLRVQCTAEATGGGPPVVGPHLPIPRDHPTVVRMLDPGAAPRWSLPVLFPGAANATTAVVVPEVRGRDVMVVVGADLTGDVVRLGEWGDDGGEVVMGIRALAGVLALLRRRLQLEAAEQRWGVANEVLTRVAASFVDQPPHDHDRAVVGAFREVGELFGYRTVGRWELEADGSVRHVCGWLHPQAGVRESDRSLTRIGADDRLLARILAGSALPIEPGVLAPTPTIASDSLLVQPIRRHGRVVAGIAAIHPDPPHAQVDIEVQREVLRRLAELVEQLDRRAEVDRELAHQLEAEDRLRRFASRLVELDAQADRDVERALAEVMAGAGVDRAVVWRTRVDGDATVVTPVFEGTGGRVAPIPDRDEIRLPGDADGAAVGAAIREVADPGDDGLRTVMVLATDRDEGATLLSLGRPGRVPFTDHELEFFRSALSILGQHQARVAAERWFHAAFRAAPIGIVLRESDGRLVHCNAAYCRLLGREVIELVGTVPADVVVDRSTDPRPHGERQEPEVAYGRPDGTVRWVTEHTVPVEVPGRREPLLLSYARDITDQRLAARQLEHQANHDELTGLPNRRAFMAGASQALRAGAPMAVLVIDLDRFKVVNDSLGHTVGDSLLVSCADRIRLSLRPGDTVCRLGGDEFALLIRSGTDGADLATLAERLLGLLREPVRVADHDIFPSGSIGIARAQAGDRVEDLLRRADIAMYAAKSQGRDRWSEFDVALQRRVDDRLRIEAELRRAIDRSELEVHYQPEVMLASGTVVGCEALVRWRHDERGLLPASAFIAIAEDSGLVAGLGRWVLTEATRQAAEWAARGHDLLVRVNLSARQLRRAVVAEVEAALGDTGLAPESLCLELTETAIMDDVAESARILGEFRSLGVRVAIDDFGTGFSSLAYLKRLPVDILKIDRTFVAGVGDDPDDVAIVESVIGLAHTLGLDVVAEGIETPTQRDELVRLGCARGQGFHFGRPVSASAMTRHLAAGPVIAG